MPHTVMHTFSHFSNPTFQTPPFLFTLSSILPSIYSCKALYQSSTVNTANLFYYFPPSVLHDQISSVWVIGLSYLLISYELFIAVQSPIPLFP